MVRHGTLILVLYCASKLLDRSKSGGPFGQVTRQNFGTPCITDYRNPYLAEVMKNLGYIQQLGLGIPLAKKELEKNGNPPPAFIVDDMSVAVVLRKQV